MLRELDRCDSLNVESHGTLELLIADTDFHAVDAAREARRLLLALGLDFQDVVSLLDVIEFEDE